MEFKLSDEIKKRILNEILSLQNPFNLNDEFTLLDFLSDFLNLKEMPSFDSRYENAYEDTAQHTVRNDDWNYEYIFGERFNILEDDRIFKSFLEKTITGNERIRSVLISLVLKHLKKIGYRLSQRYDMNDNLSFIIEEDDNSYTQTDIPKNNIPFYVVNRYSFNSFNYPHFRLTRDNWDDFGFKTYYYLELHLANDEFHSLGGMRIMRKGEFYTSLDDNFFYLSDDYCSLFQDEESYFKLKKALPDKYVSVLSALNDVAYFPSICEEFENEEGFIKSLCRNSNEAEKNIRTIRHKLNYGDVSNFFDFEFLFTPKYSEFNVNFNFNFDIDKAIPKRLYCIIGKNGVGKTLMLRDLLINLSEKKIEKIIPKIPLFGKIIVVSYSYFDSFEDLRSSLDFNFLFCGLVDTETNKPLSNDDIVIKILTSINKIEEKEIKIKYYWICSNFLDNELLSEIFISHVAWLKEIYEENDIMRVEIKKENIPNVISKMSSGQKALFFIISEIVANIRYNSLLIFDEPETHLHPNAITEFMSVIMQLLEEFDSYGIVATHSPLIVREVFSDSIFVFEKDKTVPRVRKLEFETFGENLSTINNEIFGNRDVSKYYIKMIESLVDLGKSYEEIENEIQGEVPLNLNVKILIKSLVKNRDEEPEKF